MALTIEDAARIGYGIHCAQQLLLDTEHKADNDWCFKTWDQLDESGREDFRRIVRNYASFNSLGDALTEVGIDRASRWFVAVKEAHSIMRRDEAKRTAAGLAVAMFHVSQLVEPAPKATTTPTRN